MRRVLMLLPILLRRAVSSMAASASNPVIKSGPLGFPYATLDPFLFAVYHKDDYPAGDANMGAPRKGNGADFDWGRPYRMYHGVEKNIPGFPAHPHRGFETLTVTTEGRVDHFDSVGNAGRYGGGDMQWMTAGAGCQHAEMFPLVNQDTHNHMKLFQLWLNLPARSKFATPGFKMAWAENMKAVDGQGGATAKLFAGRLNGVDSGVVPPKESWAFDSANEVTVAIISLPPNGSSFTLAPAVGGAAINRVAYVVEGKDVIVGGGEGHARAVTLRANLPTELVNTHTSLPAEVLVLQGRPIGEPVAQHGPFVMNSQAEISQAFADYRRTEFGGWKWGSTAPTFPREQGRHASYAQKDGLPNIIDTPPATAASTPKGEEL